MSNIQDINIKKEVLPIFDYSLNSFTRNKILNLLETSLISENQIIERQDILKSFITNHCCPIKENKKEAIKWLLN